jgi:hypothetical protein
MPATASVYAGVTARLSGTPDLGSVGYSLDYAAKYLDFASGTAAGQVSKVFTDKNALTAAQAIDLDLAGVLLDPLGQQITFANIKILRIKCAEANTTNLIVGNAASNGWIGPFGAATHTVAVRPGAVMLFADPAGWPVVGGTGDLLHLLNSGSAALNYEIVLIG